MSSRLLESLKALKKRIKKYPQLDAHVATVETCLAEIILTGNLTELSNAVAKAGVFVPAQETIKIIEMGHYPMGTSPEKKITTVQIAQRKKRSPDISAKLLTLYGVNKKFIELVQENTQIMAEAAQTQRSSQDVSFPTNWTFHTLTLAKRSILIALATAWKKENCEEPIFWKISSVLAEISTGSAFLVAEAFSEIKFVTGAGTRTAENQLDEFFVNLNDDKAGNILDNIVISQITYQSLLAEGWQPDRWEAENLPMSIDMFLGFLSKEGFAQVRQIGEVIEIGLADATEIYRYRGSPFASSDDQKKVKVTAPGWEHNGKLIIRSKVSEISSKGE